MVQMANPVKNVCDLCEQHCEGPTRYAHKPYVFRFYHVKQYKEVLDNYEQQNTKTFKDFNNNFSSVDNTDLIGNSDDKYKEDDEKEVEEEEDISDRDTSGDEKKGVEEREEQIGDDVSEGHYDEEREPLLSRSEDEYEEEKEPLLSRSEDEYEEEREPLLSSSEDEYDEKVSDEGIEEKEEHKLLNQEYNEREEIDKIDEDLKIPLIPTQCISSMISNTKDTIDKSLDFTMATGVAIMTGLASMTSLSKNNEWYTPTSHVMFDAVPITCIGTALAAVGLAAGVKELVNAIQERGPQLPLCEHCNECELQASGCRLFCEICGKCDQGSRYWKDGTEDTHCLIICNNCDTNCVICEAKVATVRRHHKAFCMRVHGHLSTRLYGTYRKARVIASSLMIAGILTCALPGIGWAWGLSLVTGSVIANTGIRIIAKPSVRVRCDSCNLEEDAEHFEESSGCKTWCQCCGVLDEIEGERYCLALCEDCSHE